MFIPERDTVRCDLRRAGSLIGVAVALLPWALLLHAVGVGLRTLWRRRRQRRSADPAVA